MNKLTHFLLFHLNNVQLIHFHFYLLPYFPLLSLITIYALAELNIFPFPCDSSSLLIGLLKGKMVTTPLEKASPLDAISECWRDQQPFLFKDQKGVADGRSKNTHLYEPLSELVDQNGNLQTDLHHQQVAYNVDRCPVGVKGARNETSLFSSSLSDILMHKSKLSFLCEHTKQSATY